MGLIYNNVMKHNNQGIMSNQEPDRADDGEATEVRSPLLENLVGYGLRRATNTVTADFMATLGDLGMRPVLFAMLVVVRENPGINQTSLGRSLGIQRANLVPLVNELAGRALVERRTQPRDKRAFALYLTGDGETLLEDAERRVEAHEHRILADLSPAERNTLRDLLARIRGD